MWGMLSEVTGLPVITDIESMAKWWLKRKSFSCMNVTLAAIVWSIWKTRNNMCFQRLCWSKVEAMFGTCARLIKNWKILSKPEDVNVLETWAQAMEERSARPPCLGWRPQAIESLPFERCENRVLNYDVSLNNMSLSHEAAVRT
jgi:hypothetical protein